MSTTTEAIADMLMKRYRGAFSYADCLRMAAGIEEEAGRTSEGAR